MCYAKDSEEACRVTTTGGEAGRLVGLCSDQLRLAIDEALLELEALSNSVLDTARHASGLLGTVIAQIPGGSPAEKLLLADSNALQQALGDANAKLQFADRLVQRLSNVSSNLSGLAKLMNTAELPIPDSDWDCFLTKVRAAFTMEQERRMFDAMFDLPGHRNGPNTAAHVSEDLVLFDGDNRDDS